MTEPFPQLKNLHKFLISYTRSASMFYHAEQLRLTDRNYQQEVSQRTKYAADIIHTTEISRDKMAEFYNKLKNELARPSVVLALNRSAMLHNDQNLLAERLLDSINTVFILTNEPEKLGSKPLVDQALRIALDALVQQASYMIR